MGELRKLNIKELEHFNLLHSLCKLEISQLRSKVQSFEGISQEMYDVFLRHWSETYEDYEPNTDEHYDDATYDRVEYDNICTKFSNITKFIRKINVQLDEASAEFGYYLDHNMNNKNGLDPSEHNDLEQRESDAIIELTPDLSDYAEGVTIKATLSHIKDQELLSFFICDLNGRFITEISVLGRSKHLKQFSRMPRKGEIFGLVLDDLVYRAIRQDTDDQGASSNDQITKRDTALLMDLGELVDINEESIMYQLSEDFKEFPPQAIPCILSKEDTLNQNDLKSLLKNFLYKRLDLVVIKNDESLLHVKILANSNNVESIQMQISDTNPFKTEMVEEAINNMKAIEPLSPSEKERDKRYKELTEEELEMLYEEPLGTSNPMKAVYGYDPKDEQRICRFYNPKIKGCFKGSNCRQEHSLLDEEGWTKDTKLASSVLYPREPQICYETNRIIYITPTFIWKLDRFYCQINDPNIAMEPLIWTPDEIPDVYKLHTTPLEYDVVLAKYRDDLWYRAQVMEVDDSGKMFKVFYIDYGNNDIVHLSKLAKCKKEMLQWPRQAIFCRIDDIRVIPGNAEEEINKATDLLCKTILNKEIKVKVVSHYDDLVVSIMDEEYAHIQEHFIETGLLKPMTDA